MSIIKMNKMAKKLRLQEIMVKELCIDAEEKFMPADVERKIQMKFGDLFD